MSKHPDQQGNSTQPLPGHRRVAANHTGVIQHLQCEENQEGGNYNKAQDGQAARHGFQLSFPQADHRLEDHHTEEEQGDAQLVDVQVDCVRYRRHNDRSYGSEKTENHCRSSKGTSCSHLMQAQDQQHEHHVAQG